VLYVRELQRTDVHFRLTKDECISGLTKDVCISGLTNDVCISGLTKYVCISELTKDDSSYEQAQRDACKCGEPLKQRN
jgi:hypothetical protein